MSSSPPWWGEEDECTCPQCRGTSLPAWVLDLSQDEEPAERRPEPGAAPS